MSLQQAIEDIQQLEPQAHEYLTENLDSIMENFVVFEAKASARASNLPKEFTNGISWKRTGEAAGKIVNTWGSSDKPLAKWFEEGTPDHWIEPLTPGGVLVWEATFGSHASAIFFMGNEEQGKLLYSKGHYVSGLDKTDAMARGIALGWKKAKTAILKNSKAMISRKLETIE